MMIRTIRIETLQAGQRRPYADSVYEATLKFDGHTDLQASDDPKRIGWTPSSDTVAALAKILVHDYREEPGPFEPRLEAFRLIRKGVWYVKVRQPYCD